MAREWIHGRNAVAEVLLNPRRQVFQLQLAQGIQSTGRLPDILKLAKEKQLKPDYIPRKNLDQRFGEKHQGVALETSSYTYSTIDEIIALAVERNEPLFVLLLDVLQNPQNVATLLRTAEAVGVHGVVIPKARTAEINPTVVNASSGATEHLLIAQSNLSQAIAQVKEAGAWIAGLDGGPGSQPISQVRLDGALGLVVGSEGEGMRSLTRKACDYIIALPMKGQIESLNAAVAGSVALYMALGAREKK
ncbi:MAG: 23S rRNA (guanosine(2251)-2'-O)-methyltransferase RlmB [Anaerolineae bacterium]|jgi:23S rRNA (guanosine2251-2'-O)-methyltransferase|nr:23S rRNA (guanosine(2251)-2'-O)-methyltransferase RlmB [Anaerolineae bacterium]